MKDVSLDVPQGQVVLVCGASGCENMGIPVKEVNERVRQAAFAMDIDALLECYNYPKYDTIGKWHKAPTQELSNAMVDAFKDRLKNM